MYVATGAWDTPFNRHDMLLLYIALLILAAVVSYYWWEVPCRRWINGLGQTDTERSAAPKQVITVDGTAGR